MKPVFSRFPRAAKLLPIALAVALTACGGSDDEDEDNEPFKLTIAHINDHHSNLDPINNIEMTLAGENTRVELGGFPRLTTFFKQFDGRDDVLKLHAGDANAGTLYYTLFKGKADAELMNTVCFDAMVVGNHEFDDGDAQLRDFIDALHKSDTCQTAVISANVHPQIGTPLAPQADDDYVKPYIIKEVKGVKVGIVGITTRNKAQNSSRPLPTTTFDDEDVAAQRSVDELKKQGIKHIIFVTHEGYDEDKALAAKVSDIDVIVSGDSHSLLGDFSSLGSAYSTSGPYPTEVRNKDGKLVCIGQAWEYSKAVGELQVEFDKNGDVVSCGGQSSLIVGDTFKRKNAEGQWVEVDATTKAAILADIAAHKNLLNPAPDPEATRILKTYSGQVETLKKQTIGENLQALCLVRTPGESTNRSAGIEGCEQANELARGSDAAQVVAQAFLAASPRADMAIQNAGGVRTPIKAGTLTMNDAFQILPFSNVLVEIKLSGAQIVQVLEDAVSAYLDNGSSTGGGHPYAAGLRWNLDMSKPKGSRFTNVETKDRATGVWSPIDPNRTYVVSTNDFIAQGQDGYAAFKPVYDAGNYVNTYLLYTQTFVDYIKNAKTISRPKREDYSHQVVITKDGVTLPAD